MPMGLNLFCGKRRNSHVKFLKVAATKFFSLILLWPLNIKGFLLCYPIKMYRKINLNIFKIMRKSFFVIFVLYFVVTSCQKGEIEASDVTFVEEVSIAGTFFKQNMALVDARIRSLNSTNYVKELYFVNFSDQKWEKEILIMKGMSYHDDGLSNDLIANDGIYTSTDTFLHDTVIAFKSESKLRSMLNQPIVDPSFIHSKKLSIFAESYDLRQVEYAKNGRLAILEVTCPIRFGVGGCRAEQWGWCTRCCFAVDLNNCSVTVGF